MLDGILSAFMTKKEDEKETMSCFIGYQTLAFSFASATYMPCYMNLGTGVKCG